MMGRMIVIIDTTGEMVRERFELRTCTILFESQQSVEHGDHSY